MNKVFDMKQLILVFCLLFVMQGAVAQHKRNGFTPEACLTPKEASKFFPVYSEMLSKQRAIHKKMRNLKRIKPTTDSECKKNIKKRDEYEIEIKEIQRTYHEKFMQILPAQKVYDILNAEDRFHRQMFKMAAGKKRKKR